MFNECQCSVFFFRKQLSQYSASVSLCVLNFVTLSTERILYVTSEMKQDESGFLIIKFNIKSLEDWRLLTSLERYSSSLAYIFLVCCHQHWRTRCTSISILFDWKCNYGRPYCCVQSFRRCKE